MARRTILSIFFGFIIFFIFGRSKDIAAAQASGPVDPIPDAIQVERPGVCQPWVQANQDAFGLPVGVESSLAGTGQFLEDPFSGEEGFEAVIFNNQLYLGMEADNSLGARLWRTREGVVAPTSQADWEEVAADEGGNPFELPDRAQNDHIDSLAVFSGYLYASTANRSDQPTGFRLYRSSSGDRGEWDEITGRLMPGFGDKANENLKDLQVFSGVICGGTWNEAEGAEIWCSRDGMQWSQANQSGFGKRKNRVVWSGGTFNGRIYFGVQHIGMDEDNPGDDVARIFASSDPYQKNWDEVFTGAAGSYRAMILGEFEQHLYISTLNPEGIRIYRSKSGDAGSWEPANVPGMGKGRGGYLTVVDGSVVYQGALYVAVSNIHGGWDLWRTTGIQTTLEKEVTWENVSTMIGGNPRQRYAVLTTFGDHLYAWTTNYLRGQQVMVTQCSVCQAVLVPNRGRSEFFGGRISIAYQGNHPEWVEVCSSTSLSNPDQSLDEEPGYDLRIRTMPATGQFPAKLIVAAWDGQAVELVDGYQQNQIACEVQPSVDGAGNSPEYTICEAPGDLTGSWRIIPIHAGSSPTPTRIPGRDGWLGLVILACIQFIAQKYPVKVG